MKFLDPNDACPRCGHRDIPTDGSDITSSAAYTCPDCGHSWTTNWGGSAGSTPTARRITELELNDPSRFAEPDDEGRYIYDDDQ